MTNCFFATGVGSLIKVAAISSSGMARSRCTGGDAYAEQWSDLEFATLLCKAYAALFRSSSNGQTNCAFIA
jgi:hypothetical protein